MTELRFKPNPLRAPLADIAITGPVNGMNEPDLSGSYFRVVMSKGDEQLQFRISLGAAEVLCGELSALTQPA